MNQSLLKSFAPAARIKFRETMTERAQLLGLSADKEPVAAQTVGDSVVIAGYQMIADKEAQRQKLAQMIRKTGWERVIDEAAFTWFNRFSALRYMEVHGFIPQRVRVLTSGEGEFKPDILGKAANLDFPAFPKSEIIALMMDGTQDEELYRRLLFAVCESMHAKLPLLFPDANDALELLLPDNLLRAGSLLEWFVEGLGDDEWQEIEVLGWLYQYYISELKDEYMARKTAYKKEEIPAVTQLFTPKWIVQYLVHNSLGRTWLLHYPESSLKAKMPYYIEPAPQESEVEAELKRLFSGELNPEDIKLLDPAMGSGHILVTAYEVLREIYLERGYQRQQCAQLILEKNLYGLDIDLRASEIACFALIMKAREDDPTILSSGTDLKLNLLSFRDCSVDDRTDIIQNLNASPEQKADLTAILTLFEQATLFGSLIQIPESLTGKLPALAQWLEKTAASPELLASKAAESALVFVRLAQVLGQKYDQVVSNPPYMGTKGMSPDLKTFVESKYKNGKSDLFASFILRGFDWLNPTGFNAMVTMQSWMFLSSFEDMRVDLLDNRTLSTMAHLGARAFGQISGEVVQTTAFSFMKKTIPNFTPTFFRLINGNEEDKMQSLAKNKFKYELAKQIEFQKIPGSPIAYWISYQSIFLGKKLADRFISGGRTKTHNDVKYVRYSWEVSTKSIIWKRYENGGDYRKWARKTDNIVNWSNQATLEYESHGGLRNEKFTGRQGICWPLITSACNSFTIKPSLSEYSSGSPVIFQRDADDETIYQALGLLNSIIATTITKILNPTLNLTVGDVLKIPFGQTKYSTGVKDAIRYSIYDWDAYETSWDFQALPWLPSVLPDYLKNTSIPVPDAHSIESCWNTWRVVGQNWTSEMLRLEEENNRLFIDAYGLQDELTPEVPIEQITLTVNPWYRYKPRKKTEGDDSSGPGIEAEILDEGASLPQDCSGKPGAERTRSAGPQIFTEGELRMRMDGARELVSYALGCVMGRYSLDMHGLAYAESGGEGFDSARYTTFSADDDGIVPITDIKWFDGDAAERVEAFVRTVWGEERYAENIQWLADNLGAKEGELAGETLRRYLAGDYYKDHLQTYKRRPIYWKFSSGKQKAFECLVYLHRYNKGTLSRMRMQFVVPLSGQMRGRLALVEQKIAGASSTSEQKSYAKEKAVLNAKLAELTAFDNELNHYAQMQIELDLDDGVRVNYGKFGTLLANVKDVVGKKEE